MRLLFLLSCWCLCSVTLLFGQTGERNPFEIQGSNSPSAIEQTDQPAAVRPDNPFEVAPSPRQEETTVAQPEGPLLIRRDSNPDVLDARGRTLGIHILLLVLMSLCWIFFRPLLARIYQATLNDGIFNQLYRERKSGKLGFFVPSYILFFAAAGFFLYLIGQAFEWLPSDRPWQYWQQFMLGLGIYYLVKHLILAIIGQLFPVREAGSKYSFLIMLFGIVAGTILIPANLLISYAPASATMLMVYLSLGLLTLLYLIRGGRSLLLINGFLPNGLLHFLLYICAIEIAPLLIMYRLLQG